jgi:hypothetical protein
MDNKVRLTLLFKGIKNGGERGEGALTQVFRVTKDNFKS